MASTTSNQAAATDTPQTALAQAKVDRPVRSLPYRLQAGVDLCYLDDERALEGIRAGVAMEWSHTVRDVIYNLASRDSDGRLGAPDPDHSRHAISCQIFR